MSAANYYWNASEQERQLPCRMCAASGYQDQTLELFPVEQRKIGPAVRERLIAIMTGKVPDPHSWVEASGNENREGTRIQMHYLLFYEVGEDYVTGALRFAKPQRSPKTGH